MSWILPWLTSMLQPTEHVTPPHLELLGAPEVRPFKEALADARVRFDEEVKRLVSLEERALRPDNDRLTGVANPLELGR